MAEALSVLPASLLVSEDTCLAGKVQLHKTAGLTLLSSTSRHHKHTFAVTLHAVQP